MTATLDVNVLVYAADERSSRHDRARSFLDDVARSTSLTYLFWPVLIGYVRIITHPRIIDAPLSPEEAMQDIEGLISRPQIVTPGEGDHFWSIFRNVASEVRPRATLVPDAYLVALMREHGVTTIWTNDGDFNRFDGITVRNPFATPR